MMENDDKAERQEMAQRRRNRSRRRTNRRNPQHLNIYEFNETVHCKTQACNFIYLRLQAYVKLRFFRQPYKATEVIRTV